MVFVGGSGRSGTTVLRRALSAHPDTATLYGEARFITDPGGVVDLYRALTTDWTPYAADAALDRFLTALSPGGYMGDLLHRFAVRTGTKWDRGPVADLLDAFEYTTDAATWLGTGGKDRDFMYWIPSYGDHATFAAALRRFVETVYAVWNPDGFTHVVDDTPHSVLLDVPESLFPDQRRVLCVRHPYDVLDSFLNGKFTWTPKDPRTAARIIHDVFLRARTRSHVLRLEDVMVRPELTLHKLCVHLGLSGGHEETMAAAYRSDKAHAERRRNLTPEQLDAARPILSPLCELFRYEVDV